MKVRFDRRRLAPALLTGIFVGAAMAGCALIIDLDPKIPDAPLIIGLIAGAGTATVMLFIR